MASVLETSLSEARVFKSCIPGWTGLFWDCYSVKTSRRKQSEWIETSPCSFSLYFVSSMAQTMELRRAETWEAFLVWDSVVCVFQKIFALVGFWLKKKHSSNCHFYPFTSRPYTSIAHCNIVCSTTGGILKLSSTIETKSFSVVLAETFLMDKPKKQ